MIVSWDHKGDNSATVITNPFEIKCHSFIHSFIHLLLRFFFSGKIKRESRQTGKEQKKKNKEEEEEDEEEERLIAGSRISGV